MNVVFKYHGGSCVWYDVLKNVFNVTHTVLLGSELLACNIVVVVVDDFCLQGFKIVITRPEFRPAEFSSNTNSKE